MPAALVATVLAGLTAAVALLLIVMLARRARAGAGSWRDVGWDFARRAWRPLPGLMAAALLMAGAELLLPAERIATEVNHLQVVEGGAVELSYSLCCTGGGTEACVVPGGAALRPGQAIELRRTRLLGRCSARVLDGPPAPCRCS
ncbi:hypothetical protein ACS5PK_04655 [Roseateles sp. DB2]|uniref:hypothetical protein n=1 Tax=Roseateles sp. DB2 TaxID=3453717 RepID=UPI003EE8AD4B